MAGMKILGIDIGGSAVKIAPVSSGKGKLLQERLRIPTPQPATPAALARLLASYVKEQKWKGPIGVGFPATVIDQVVMTANNIDKSWIGVHAGALFSEASSCPVYVLNDADAAGLAEVRYGAGQGVKGVVIVITIGTGVGSAVFINGKLLPNCELGQLRMVGDRAETYVSDAMRKKLSLSWEEWTHRMNRFLSEVEDLFSPSLIIIGGGVSHKTEHYLADLQVRSRVVTARLQNEAGMIGAAIAAKKYLEQ